MDWSGVGYLWIMMFLSAVWTLILTAPIHCRGSIGEQVMQCYTSPNLFRWRNIKQVYNESQLFKRNHSHFPQSCIYVCLPWADFSLLFTMIVLSEDLLTLSVSIYRLVRRHRTGPLPLDLRMWSWSSSKPLTVCWSALALARSSGRTVRWGRKAFPSIRERWSIRLPFRDGSGLAIEEAVEEVLMAERHRRFCLLSRSSTGMS